MEVEKLNFNHYELLAYEDWSPDGRGTAFVIAKWDIPDDWEIVIKRKDKSER